MSTVAGIAIPDSTVARAADGYAREHSPGFLLGHCRRTYVFGALATAGAGLEVREDLAYVAALLHDLGLTSLVSGRRRFEVDGADAAYAWARGQGVASEDAQLIWDAIALHTSQGIADQRSPECALVHWGAGVDVAGLGLDTLPPDAVAAVTTAYPRDGFQDNFAALLNHTARRDPHLYALTWLASTAARHEPSLPTSEDLVGAPRRDPFPLEDRPR